MPFRFKPPSVTEGPIGDHRLFQFYEMPRGITVLKINGEYYETRWPQQEDLDIADKWYLGGSWTTVSEEEAQDLIDAGYEVEEI
jgi:hypothetical protein